MADMIELARQYGRYGYRRIAALLRRAGWQVNDKRNERLWKREGLKVPAKQPKKARLWFNDNSCVRLRPEYPNYVWSYDFVHDRTHDGRAFRTLNLIDEYTKEVSDNPGEAETQLHRCYRRANRSVHPAGATGLHPFRQLTRVRRRNCLRLDCRCWGTDRLYRPSIAMGKWLLRELQCPVQGRAAQRRDILHPQRGPDRHRGMAQTLQHGSSA